MKEGSNGGQADEAQQQEAGSEDAQEQGEVTALGGAGDDYQAMLAKRDERIAEFEAQVADASASKEAAEALRGEIEAVKTAEMEDERVEYELRLVGARSVTAAKALLADHGGDVVALKVSRHVGDGVESGPTPAARAVLAELSGAGIAFSGVA